MSNLENFWGSLAEEQETEGRDNDRLDRLSNLSDLRKARAKRKQVLASFTVRDLDNPVLAKSITQTLENLQKV